MGTLHCALENEADSYINECQVIRLERRRKKTTKKKNAQLRFFTSRGAYVNCAIIAMFCTRSIGNHP